MHQVCQPAQTPGIAFEVKDLRRKTACARTSRRDAEVHRGYAPLRGCAAIRNEINKLRARRPRQISMHPEAPILSATIAA
jgi:hypothetical protein